MYVDMRRKSYLIQADLSPNFAKAAHSPNYPGGPTQTQEAMAPGAQPGLPSPLLLVHSHSPLALSPPLACAAPLLVVLQPEILTLARMPHICYHIHSGWAGTIGLRVGDT